MTEKMRLSFLWILCLLIVCEFIIKVRLFVGLSYTSDLFNLIQGSTSIFKGLPIFYENCSGDGSYTHNYFLMMLIGPLNLLLGAYGFFLIAFILSLVAVIDIHRIRSIVPASYIIAFSMLTCPISLWMLDDPLYGWHNELLYVPLSVLSVTTYLRSRRLLSYLSLAAIALNKEDGAVLACCIHLLITLHENKDSIALAWKALTIRVIFWATVFYTGIIFLKYMSPRGSTRLSGAIDGLSTIWTDPNGYSNLLTVVNHSLVLFFCSVTILLLIVRPRFFLWGIIFISPVIAVQFLSTLAYYPDLSAMRYHSLTWPARWASIWSSLLVLLILGSRPNVMQYLNPIVIFIVTLINWSGQSWALQYVRLYSTRDSLSVLTGNVLPTMYEVKLRRREIETLYCLRDALPLETPIATGGMLFGIFHKHDVAAASHETIRANPAKVYICDSMSRLPFEGNCAGEIEKLPDQRFTKTKFVGFSYATTSDLAPYAIGCIKSLKGAIKKSNFPSTP